MGNTFCLLDLARDLAEIASETHDADTAIRLIALANEVLAAGGHLPVVDEVEPFGGSGQAA
jgi:hypothetical protein